MTTKSKKILSVSVAAYNVEDYLEETLASCCSISKTALSKIEVLIVNDGSKDNTLEIAHKFAAENPSIFKVIDKPNGGYGSTFNAALAQASGNYFRYLDGDDTFDSSALESYIALLEGIDADAVFTPYLRCYENDGTKELIDTLPEYTEGVIGIRDLRSEKNIAACSLAYKTEFLKTCDFRMTEHCFYTDVEYAYIPLEKAQNLVVSKLPLYRYRIGREGQSVSLAGIERHCKDIFRVRARLLNELGSKYDELNVYLQRCLIRELASPYRFITMLEPDSQRKFELKSFDATLRSYPSIYREIKKSSKIVSVLSFSGFNAYNALCFYRKRRS